MCSGKGGTDQKDYELNMDLHGAIVVEVRGLPVTAQHVTLSVSFLCAPSSSLSQFFRG